MKEPSFKCKKCGGPTKHVWTSKDGKVVGLQCVNGHYETSNKRNMEKGPTKLVHPVVIVPVEEA